MILLKISKMYIFQQGVQRVVGYPRPKLVKLFSKGHISGVWHHIAVLVPTYIFLSKKQNAHRYKTNQNIVNILAVNYLKLIVY